MISIIVTARNQAVDLRRCLNALLDGAASDELEIIVVCNGCDDETLRVARGFSPAVRVLEIESSSRAQALNVADRAASAFPRFYIQAGVTCRLTSIRRMAQHLCEGSALAVAPPIRVRLHQPSGVVRQFYEIAERLPSHLDGLHGSGVFGLSRAGKERFAEFPEVVAIEEFIRASLAADQFVRLESTRSWVTPPSTFTSLLAAEAGLIRGVKQLRALNPSLPIDIGRNDRQALRQLFARRADLWLELIVYVFVRLLARLFAIGAGRPPTYQREEDARSTAAAAESADLIGEL
jgi:glycosyltransferase involved in cell wall biosynthesis